MKFDKYINEAKIGKLPQKIQRTAYMKDYPELLKWELINPNLDNERANYNAIEGVAWKEAITLRKKGIIGFNNNDFDIFSVHGPTINYEANLKLREYDDRLIKELKKMKFKIK